MENTGVLAGRRCGWRCGDYSDSGGNLDPLICSVYCVYRVKIVDNR